MNLLISILVGALLAYIAELLLVWLGLPGPLPMVIAIVVFLMAVFGGHRWNGGGF